MGSLSCDVAPPLPLVELLPCATDTGSEHSYLGEGGTDEKKAEVSQRMGCEPRLLASNWALVRYWAPPEYWPKREDSKGRPLAV